MKTVKAALNGKDVENVVHTLKYMNTAIRDYPAEFFLQPPYLCHALMHLLTSDGNVQQQQPKEHGSLTLEVLINLTKSIQKQINIRQLTETYSYPEIDESDEIYNQMTVSFYCYESIKISLEYFKTLINVSDGLEITRVFSLLMEIMALLQCVQSPKEQFNDILEEFSFLVHYYRQRAEGKSSDHSFRANYLIGIQIMAQLSLIVYPKDDPATKRGTEEFTLNKNWVKELEIALLDVPLKHSYPKVYALIEDAIEPSKSIKDLLNSIEILYSAVHLLRQPDGMANDELILKGLNAMETLHIHKSVDLVKVLFRAICGSAIDCNAVEILKNNREKLFLKLLSHEMIEVKRLVYHMTAEKVKYFFSCVSDGEMVLGRNWDNQPNDFYFIGVPLTVNILIEIICFGYNHSETVIHANAETILLFIIRGKTVLGRYWNKIMEIVYPVMSLLQCVSDQMTGIGEFKIFFVFIELSIN